MSAICYFWFWFNPPTFPELMQVSGWVWREKLWDC